MKPWFPWVLVVASTASFAQQCPPLEAAREPLPTAPGSGRHSVSRAGGFTDHYLWGPGERVKIGVREDWGGSIVYFGRGDGRAADNVIDAHDTGREVQLALYDPDRHRQGCAHDASCRARPQAACSTSIAYVGWNPTQGGNKCNRGARLLRLVPAGGVLEVETAPLHWNPDWRDAGCGQAACASEETAALEADVRFRQHLRFVGEDIVELELEVANLGDESHAATPQEFPTVYATYGARGTRNLQVLLNSALERIAVDQPANDGFSVREFVSSGGWATLQEPSRELGVALYTENRTQRWQGWGKPGVFNNMRPLIEFGLPARGTVRARSYLILGSQASVAQRAQDLERRLPPFGGLDAPAPAATPGSFVVSGWALDNKAVRAVELWVDGDKKLALATGERRAQVCAQWPGYANCRRAGFRATLALPQASACATVEAIAVDDDGNRRVIGHARLAP